jgi:hypothetical protein
VTDEHPIYSSSRRSSVFVTCSLCIHTSRGYCTCSLCIHKSHGYWMCALEALIHLGTTNKRVILVLDLRMTNGYQMNVRKHCYQCITRSRKHPRTTKCYWFEFLANVFLVHLCLMANCALLLLKRVIGHRGTRVEIQ